MWHEGGGPVFTIRIKQRKKSLFTSHCINFNVIPMTMKNVFVVYSVLIIILTVCITGCSSLQSSPIEQNNTPTITTLSQTIPTTTLGTQVPPPPTTDQRSTISTTETPKNEVITMTLNSAEKKISLGNSIGKPGRSLLILDITIKNNDKKNDFKYTDSSFVISYKSGLGSLTAITSQYANNPGLINPLISGTVMAGSIDDGRILFGVNATSYAYKLSVVDSSGTELTSIDNIYVP